MTKEEMAILSNSFCGGFGVPDRSEIFLHDDYSSDDDNSSHSPEIVVRDAEVRCKCSNTSQLAKPPSNPAVYSKSLQCVSCKMFFQEDDQMEADTNADYHCLACKDCTKCIDSDFTDKINIRKEVDQKSVEDQINEKILVSLPNCVLDASTYVDDMTDGIENAGKCMEQCKQWPVSNQESLPTVSDDELYPLISRFNCFPKVDSVSGKIPPLHFGKSARGNLRLKSSLFI